MAPSIVRYIFRQVNTYERLLIFVSCFISLALVRKLVKCTVQYIINKTFILFTTCGPSPEAKKKKKNGGGIRESFTIKGGTGMSGSRDPLFTPLPLFFAPSCRERSLDHHFEQNFKSMAPTREISQKVFERSHPFSLNLPQISVHKPSKCLRISIL